MVPVATKRTLGSDKRLYIRDDGCPGELEKFQTKDGQIDYY